MTATLSPELSGLLQQVGGTWPDADENQLLDMADGWRGMREQLETIRAEGNRSVRAAAAHNEGDGWRAFVKYWLENIDKALDHLAEIAAFVESALLALTEALLKVKQAIVDALDWVAKQIEKAKSGASHIPIIGGAVKDAIEKIIEPIFRAARDIILKVVNTIVDLITKHIVPLLVTLIRKLRAIIDFFRKLVKALRGEAPPPQYTEPSHKPNPEAKPRGPRTPVEGSTKKKEGIELENKTADILARAGYDIEQNPPEKGVNGRSDPDYKIEGKLWDCYAPTTDNANTIRSELRDKVKNQSPRIILNLERCPLSIDEIREILPRVKGLEEVKIIDQFGRIINVFPE